MERSADASGPGHGTRDLVGAARWDPSTVESDADRHARFLEEAAESPPVKAAAAVSFDLLALGVGARVLEVGCGSGYLLPRLAEAVGPTGAVVGIDTSETLLEHARRRLEEAGVGQVATVEKGDANDLRFADGEFDAARTERVLMHQEDPNVQLREMKRSVKPGGTVVAIEPDLGCCHLDGPGDFEAVRMLWKRLVAGTRSPSVGIELYRRLDEVGLVDRRLVNCSTLLFDYDDLHFGRWDETAEGAWKAGDIDRARAEAAVEDLRRGTERRQVTCMATMYVGSAKVPALPDG